MPSATQSQPRSQTSIVAVKVDGQPLAPDVAAKIVEATIEQDLVLPDAFAIRFRDIATATGSNTQTLFGMADRDEFRVGREIELSMGREEKTKTAMKGEITALELEMRADGVPGLTVRGYDKGHRLNRQKKTRTFTNHKISDIVQQVANDSGLTSKVDDTMEVYEHVFQDNQTDWEFVRGLARTIGKEAFVTDSALNFRTPAVNGAPIEQEFGQSLRQMRLRMTSSAQVGQVEVRGWDPKKKQAVTVLVKEPGDTAPKDKGKVGGDAASVFGSAKFILNDHTIASHEDAKQRAQSILDELSGGFVQLDCVCLGDADLKPGRQIKIKGISTRFAGEYYISATTHQTTPDRGYVTNVVVSGRQPNSLTALVSSNAARPGAPSAARSSFRHPGVVVGIVSNNQDPDDRGRVKLRFPWFDDSLESNWAPVASPMAGKDRGFFWLPEIDDEVLVAFDHGDINHPYVVGSLWNGIDKPPKRTNEVISGGNVNQRIIKSRSGHVITIDDTSGQESISIVDKTGSNSIKLESPTNKLTVAVNGDMILDASRGNLSLKGLTVSVEGIQSLTVKAPQTDVKATAKLSLDGGAMTEVKGGMVKLN